MDSVCQLIERDIVAVIGVNLKNLDQQVSSILNYFGIPMLQINPSLAWDNEKTGYNTTVNLYPSRKVLSEAVIDILVDFKWDQVTIFYQDDQDILLWSEFLSLSKPVGVLRPLFLKLPKSHQSLLQVLVDLKQRGSHHNFVFFSSDIEMATGFMSACQTSGLLNMNTNLLISSVVSLICL